MLCFRIEADTDYTTKSGTITFIASQTSKTVNIVVKVDTAVEQNEKFNVKLSNCSTGCSIIDNTGVGTITNDDSS